MSRAKRNSEISKICLHNESRHIKGVGRAKPKKNLISSSKFGYPVSFQTDNKINFGAGGNRKKAKVSLAKVKLKDSEEEGGMK